MSNIGWVSLTLPSKGQLYGDQIPDGKIEIRKITTREEAILLSSGSRGVERIDAIINACSRLPNGFKHEDLLLQDRMAILLGLRTHTFGDGYQVPYQCASCKAHNKESVNITDDLELKEAPDELSEPVMVSLPDNGAMVGLRFLRGVDEERIAKHAKRVMMRSNDIADPSYIYRLALQIVTIDEQEEISIRDREAFVRDLSAADSAAMRNAIDEAEPGIDLRVFAECRSCGYPNEFALPFTADFFRPAAV